MIDTEVEWRAHSALGHMGLDSLHRSYQMDHQPGLVQRIPRVLHLIVGHARTSGE